MKTIRFHSLSILLGLVLVPVVVCFGCGLVTTDDSDEDDLGITPTYVTLSADRVTSVTFTVSGGSGSYTWSLADDTLGSLVAGNEVAIYTNYTVEGDNTVAVSDGLTAVGATVTQE